MTTSPTTPPPLTPPRARPIRSGRARAANSALALLALGTGILAATWLVEGGTHANAVAVSVAAGVALLAALTGLARLIRGTHGRLDRRFDSILQALSGISAEADTESVLTACGRAAADLLPTRKNSPVIARVFRIERGTMVLASDRGTAPRALLASRPLSADPLIMAAVTGDRTLAEAGPDPHRVAGPIHDGAGITAVLLAENPRRSFHDADIVLLDGLANIASLAIGSLARESGPVAAEPVQADWLTGLGTRAAFEHELAQVRDVFAVISVDIDHLDQLNDALGREAGDDILRSVAHALLSSTREHDVVCRTDGDGFTILMSGAATAIVGSVAERIRAAVAELVSGTFPVRVSVGWAVGAAGDDPTAVWGRAEDALGRAQREGRNRVAGSIAGRPATAPGRGWSTLLSRVLASQQINPVYQPIVTLPEAHIVAYEGLARPANLDGADSVEEFFATAQRLGVTNELDWICRRAVVRGAEGIRTDLQLYVNIDLAAVADVNEDVEQMLSLLEWVGRDPASVVLEVADADRFNNLGQLASRIDQYRRAGFRIGIDDAGRAGIGVDTLYAVRPDVIKIDASVSNRFNDDDARALIFECIALAEQIGAEVVAEGIEKLSVAAELTRLGITRGQGFLFGRPDTVAAPTRELEGEPVLRVLVG